MTNIKYETTTTIKTFKGNLGVITKLQKEFTKNAEEFLFYRKGEFENAEEILPYLPIVAGGLIKIYKFIKNKIELKKIQKNKPFQIVTAQTPENEIFLKKFKRFGATISIIDENKRGRIRYFLNDKEFCIFFRKPDNTFWGFRGNDIFIKKSLRELFEAEFNSGIIL
jgi:hypothetical protein